MKANYKKSRVKMTKKHQRYAKLFTQEEVNEALEEYEAKQKALTEAASKKKRKRGGRKKERSKGKTVLKGAAQPPTTPVASRGLSGAQRSDSEGWFTNCKV